MLLTLEEPVKGLASQSQIEVVTGQTLLATNTTHETKYREVFLVRDKVVN